MPAPKCSEAEFVEVFERGGAPELQRLFGLSASNVYHRRRYIETRIGRSLNSPTEGRKNLIYDSAHHPERISWDIRDGTVICFSDAHYWPSIITPAHRALIKFCKELKPSGIVANGDMFDGARISRHPSIGWEDKPSVIQEIETVQERLGEVVSATPKKKRAWTLGNHDSRFESRLANVAPEYAKVHGVHLKDHVTGFEPCWSVWINADSDHPVVVKHRYKGGRYAPANNTLYGGASIVTGHLHSLKVFPHTDYRGTRWGVDCGTLADAYGVQFTDYTEDSPRDWRSGFVVLTFSKGELLTPEIVRVMNQEEVDFRGKRITI